MQIHEEIPENLRFPCEKDLIRLKPIITVSV